MRYIFQDEESLPRPKIYYIGVLHLLRFSQHVFFTFLFLLPGTLPLECPTFYLLSFYSLAYFLFKMSLILEGFFFIQLSLDP